MRTIEDMRMDIAGALDIPAADLSNNANLFDLGLDSIRVMDLFLRWEADGLNADFSRFYEAATLEAWWQIASSVDAPAG